MASVIRGNDNFDSSSVPDATPSRESVGSYGFLYKTTGGFNESQADQAGSGMFFNNAGTQGTISTSTGTWRCMGMIYGNGSATGRVTLWLRIS